MAVYRIRKSNVPPSQPKAEGLAFVRPSSNRDGITLDRIAFTELPLVRDQQTGRAGRQATVITNIDPDPSDPDFVICKTKDLILPASESDIQVEPPEERRI